MTEIIKIKGIDTRFKESTLLLTKSTSILKIVFRRGLDCDYTKVIVERNGKPEMTSDYPNKRLDEFIESIKSTARRNGYEEVL